MTRIRRLILPVVCAVVITGASAAVAREVKHATPGSGACDQDASDATTRKPSTAVREDARPAREAKARPSVHGDAPTGGRLQSPRWHSFLPGMFR